MEKQRKIQGPNKELFLIFCFRSTTQSCRITQFMATLQQEENQEYIDRIMVAPNLEPSRHLSQVLSMSPSGALIGQAFE